MGKQPPDGTSLAKPGWFTVTFGKRMASVFFDIALPQLGRLVMGGASIATESPSKRAIVKIRKGAKRIEIVYEPYGLPFCDVITADGGRKRLELDVPFTSAGRMARGDKTTDVLEALKSDIRSYIDALYPIIEDELR